MKASICLLLASAVLTLAHGPDQIYSKVRSRQIKHQHARREAAKHVNEATLQKRQSSQFLNANSQQFVVDGTALPDVPFDIGESYAGLLPISSAANETRELFFWFFPSSNPDASNEIGIWLNGGPGCSSLNGLLQENGPFLWEPGTFAPTLNPYSFTNLTNFVWIEQPVRVGYSQGTPNITNEVELAQEFAGFWRNFIDTFEMQNYEVYVTGESYGGFYVPYISDNFLSANDSTYYNLKGNLIIDPIIGGDTIQQEIPIQNYVQTWNQNLNLNSTFLAQMDSVAESCGYTDYFDTYFQFPPPAGPFPNNPNGNNDTCDIFDLVYAAALEVNPCFNVYHHTDQCPFLYSVLGVIANGYEPPGAQVYFNRSDVQQALHTPPTNWEECVSPVFAGRGRDQSPGPATNGVLSRVIDGTQNVIIAVGKLDFLLPVNGTLLSIQNITWGGTQGFQSPPTSELFVPYHPDPNLAALSGAGIFGEFVSERGLTFAQVNYAGHMIPEYTPGAAYRMLEQILGRIDSLDTPGSFTTQTGSYGKRSTPQRRVPRRPIVGSKPM